MHINYQKKAREPLKYSWSVHLGVFSFETMKWQQLELQKNSIPLKQSPLSMHIANDVMILVESGLEQRIVCNESPSQVRPFVLRTDLRRAFDYQHGAEMSKAYRIPLR
jgi:hypothetical protein